MTDEKAVRTNERRRIGLQAAHQFLTAWNCLLSRPDYEDLQISYTMAVCGACWQMAESICGIGPVPDPPNDHDLFKFYESVADYFKSQPELAFWREDPEAASQYFLDSSEPGIVFKRLVV